MLISVCYPPWPWSWCKCQWPPKVEKRNKWSMKCYLPATFRHRELSCLQPFNLYYWVLRLSWSFVSLASVRIRSFSFKLYFTQCRPGTVAGSLQFVWSSLVVGRSAVKLFIYQSDDTPPPKKKLNFEKRIKKKVSLIFLLIPEFPEVLCLPGHICPMPWNAFAYWLVRVHAHMPAANFCVCIFISWWLCCQGALKESRAEITSNPPFCDNVVQVKKARGLSPI